jgi:hypothetical protein
MTKPSSWHHALHHMQIRIEFNRRERRSSPSLANCWSGLQSQSPCACPLFGKRDQSPRPHPPREGLENTVKEVYSHTLRHNHKLNRKRNVPQVGVLIPLRGPGRMSRFSHIHALHDGHAATAGRPSLLVCCILLALLHLELPSSQAAHRYIKMLMSGSRWSFGSDLHHC